jgi:TPR repeat protein
LAKGVAMLRRGIELGDTDSMLTLAELIENGSVAPQNPNETPLELYKRAAELGNDNGARACQGELAKAQQAQQQQMN